MAVSYLPDNVWVEIYTAPSGVPTWTNIGGDIVSQIECNLGFTDGDQLSRLAGGSDMRFDLDNANSAYNPSSTFYKGQKIRLRIKYGSLVKTKFFGYIDHISLDPGTFGAQQAHVTCIDWLGLAAVTPVRSLPSLTNTTIGAALTVLLTQMQIQPEALDVEAGTIIMPSVFDQVTPNSTIYSELQNLVMGEWGYIYMRDGGMTLKVENSLSRTGDGSDYKTTSYYKPDGVATPFLLEDATAFLLEDGTAFEMEGEPTAGSFNSNLSNTYTDIAINHGDNLTNQILATAVPVVIGGSTVVLYPFDITTGSSAILVTSNTASTPYILQGQYKDPTAGGAQISGNSVITPVIVTDWKFNSKADGTGTDLSANITISFTAGQSGFKALIVNSGAPGYITKFNVRGTPVYRYNPVETVVSDQRSIWDYGQYSMEFTRQYGQSSNDIQPYMFRIIMRNRKPRTVFSNPKFNGYDSADHLAGFLALDIGDQIRLTSTKPSSDALYYIQGVHFAIQPGGESITFDYITTETLAGAVAGVTELAIENAAITNNGISFNYIPTITDNTFRTVTARIYLNSLASTGYIFANQIFLFYVNGITGALVLNRATTAVNGTWTQNVPSITTGSWFNVAVTYDSSSLSNNPVFYVNGSSVASSVTFAPTGSIQSEVGYSVGIGSNSGGTGTTFLGKLCNVAVYNRILTASEISTIHNGGTRLPFASYPMTGLKFFFGGMDSDSYTSKLNSTLGTLDTVYELVNGFTGRPMNSPTLRAVG